MRILLDTNIILDIFLNRKPFVEESMEALQKSVIRGDKLFFSSSSVTDVYYVIRKIKQDKKYALECIKKLAGLLSFAQVNEECILKSLNSRMNDYEDALIDTVANDINADLIMTRNVADFVGATTAYKTPIEYINDKL